MFCWVLSLQRAGQSLLAMRETRERELNFLYATLCKSTEGRPPPGTQEKPRLAVPT